MKMRNLLFGVVSIAVMTLVSCQQDEVKAPSITVDKDAISLPATGGEETLMVLSTRDWTVDVQGDNVEGIAVSPASGTASGAAVPVTVTALENTGSAITASIVFTISGGSYTVAFSQAGAGEQGGNEPVVEGAFDHVINAAVGDAVTVTGLVVAVNNRGMVINQGNDNLLLYNSDASDVPPVTICDSVSVSGTRAVYGDLPQVAFSYNDITVINKGNTVSYPEPTKIDASNIATIDRTTCHFIEIEGVLSIEGNYRNINIDGTTVRGSLSYTPEALNVDNLAGRRANFKGYFGGGNNDSFVNLVVVASMESATPYISVSPLSASAVAAGEEVTLSILSNCDAWTATSSDDANFSITSGASGSKDGTITVKVASNPGEARSAVITVVSSADASLSQEITINQAAAPTGNETTVSFNLDAKGQSWAADTHTTYGAGFAYTDEASGIKVGFYKHESTTTPINTSDGHIRVYKNSELVVTLPNGGTIKSVTLECTGSSNCSDMTVSDGTTAEKSGDTIVWNGSIDVFAAQAVNGQVRIKSISITYEPVQ